MVLLMLYPKIQNIKKNKIIEYVLLIISIIVSIVLLIINKVTSDHYIWAILSIFGIIYMWITVMYSVNKHKNIASYVLLQTIILSCLLIGIDYILGFYKWSFSIAIPIVIIVANVTMLILTIISHKKYIKYAIYQFIIFLSSMLPLIWILTGITKKITLPVIALSIAGISFILCIILSGRDMKEELVRKFHM